MIFRPKYITFDCYGTLIRFHMGEMTREIFADRIPAAQMAQFIADFSSYRMDEVLGDWKPYSDVLKNAMRRLCKKWRIQSFDAEASRYYNAVPTWGPHEDVPAGLAKTISVEHPTGEFSVELEIDPQNSENVVSAALLRTARLIMRGEVMVPAALLK